MMDFVKPSPCAAVHVLKIETTDFTSKPTSRMEPLFFLSLYDFTISLTSQVLYQPQTAFPSC